MIWAATMIWLAFAITGALVVSLFWASGELALIWGRFREWHATRQHMRRVRAWVRQGVKRRATEREIEAYILRQKQEQRR